MRKMKLEINNKNEEIKKLKEQIDSLKAELENKKREACNKLKQMLKSADAGVVGNRKISWKMVHKKSYNKDTLKERGNTYEQI